MLGISSRASSAEIVLHRKRNETLYLIPKAWAFSPNVHTSRFGIDKYDPQYSLSHGVGTIRLTIDNELELITTDCKAEIFQEITPENIQYLNILGTPPKWLKYAWFKFNLTSFDEDDLEFIAENFVYHGFSGMNRHILGESLSQFVPSLNKGLADLAPALEANSLYTKAFGFVGVKDNVFITSTFYSGVSLGHKQILHHHLDEPLALASLETDKENILDKKTISWVNERLEAIKCKTDKLEEVILKEGAIDAEEVVQVFRINNSNKKVLLLLRNRFSNEVSSSLLGSELKLKVVGGSEGISHATYYEYRSKELELVGMLSGNGKFCHMDLFTKDADVLTALFETTDGKVKFHVVDKFDDFKKVIEIVDNKATFDIVYYDGGLNLVSLPIESASISDEVLEFLEDQIQTEEGNW